MKNRWRLGSGRREATSLALLCLFTCAGCATARGPRAVALELAGVKLGIGEVMPDLLHREVPAYPPEAAGAWGTVDIEAVVGTSGTRGRRSLALQVRN
jgi:hypothetical protein